MTNIEDIKSKIKNNTFHFIEHDSGEYSNPYVRIKISEELLISIKEKCDFLDYESVDLITLNSYKLHECGFHGSALRIYIMGLVSSRYGSYKELNSCIINFKYGLPNEQSEIYNY